MNGHVALSISAALAMSCAGSDRAEEATSLPDYSTGTHLVLLGTGTPNAEPDRSGPAVAIVVNGRPYLVDAGPGVVRRARAAQQAGIEPLAVNNLAAVFITHLHSDHTLGLADLIFTPWVLGRDVPLSVYGPAGVGAVTEALLSAYEQDIRIRLDGREPANAHGYEVDAFEIEPGVVFEDENVRVTAIAVSHGSWPAAFGFRFDAADRSIVVSGDATPSETLVQACSGCDVLVHEVYSQRGFEKREPIWQRYHSSFHTSSVQLAEIARRAEPKLLVLYHQLLWGTTPEELTEEIRGAWDGRVVFGRDLDVY